MNPRAAQPIAVIDGRARSAADADAITEAGETTVRVRWPDGVTLELRRSTHDGETVLGTTVTADHEVTVDSIGVWLPSTSDVILVDGYQSWDWAGTRSLGQAGHGWWGAVFPGASGLERVALVAAPRAGALNIQWSGDAPGIQVLTTGAPHDRQHSVAIPLPLGHQLRAGESFGSDPIVCGPVTAVGAGLPQAPIGWSAGRRVTGWMSWNSLGRDVRSSDVLAAAAGVPPGGVVLVDDGWAPRWGDWTSFGPGFPEGIASLAQRIAHQGQLLGLWIAPFVIHPECPVSLEHPDWILGGSTHRPVVGPQVPDEHHVLDASLPSVRQHLHDLGLLLGQWGVTVVKADFLYAGGLGPERNGMNGIAALRAGMEAFVSGFRSVVPNGLVWGCGAPAPPLVGLVDALRSGADSVFDQPVGAVAPAGNRGSTVSDVLRGQERNLQARAWLWGSTLPPDIDAVTLGDLGDLPPLDDEDAWNWLEMAVASGGPVITADVATSNVPSIRQAWLRDAAQRATTSPPVPVRRVSPFAVQPVAMSNTTVPAPAQPGLDFTD